MFKCVLVLLFIFKIRFPRNKPINNVIVTRYGQDGLSTFRKYESINRKLMKAEEDLHFLRCCKSYNVFPKFIHFKLYRADLQTTNDYKEYQEKLLDNEIREKIKLIDLHNQNLNTEKSRLRDLISGLDLACLTCYLNDQLKKQRTAIQQRHEKKLQAIGARASLKLSLIHI